MPTVEYGASADELCSLYREYDWWADRELDDLRRALQNTDETILLRDAKTGEPVASTRVMTDYGLLRDGLRRPQKRGLPRF